MAAKLALVTPATAPVAHPRPFATYYYRPRTNDGQWCARGRACTLEGAAVAALRRIIQRRVVRAAIYGPDGIVVARIERQGRRIVCVGV